MVSFSRSQQEVSDVTRTNLGRCPLMRCRTVFVSTLLVFWFFVTVLAAQSRTEAAASPINVLTYHNDVGRTGLMPLETILTPANVNTANFGKINFLPTDGKVGGEPLYVSNVNINNVIHNVVYVVT